MEKRIADESIEFYLRHAAPPYETFQLLALDLRDARARISELEGNALDGSAKRVTEPAAQEARDAVWKLTTAAIIFGHTENVELMNEEERAITKYQEIIFSALEGAERPGEPLGEPEQSPVTPKLPIEETKHE